MRSYRFGGSLLTSLRYQHISSCPLRLHALPAYAMATTAAPNRSGGGKLSLVPTPIGNLQDISLRALNTLKESNLILAEDTRVCRRLLHAVGLEDCAHKVISANEHNSSTRVRTLLARLQAGESVALVSDAGTPCISDPGVELVRAVKARGLTVEALPGPCAIPTAISASGLDIRGTGFAFLGFLEAKGEERERGIERVKQLAAAGMPVLLYEAPHRLKDTLWELSQSLEGTIGAAAVGEGTSAADGGVAPAARVSKKDGKKSKPAGEVAFVPVPVALCRELTKLHEEVLFFPSLAAAATAHGADGRSPPSLETRGEYVLVIGYR